VAAAGSRVCLDLNSPQVQGVFFRLEAMELKQVIASLRPLRELDWDSLSTHMGFRWEAIGPVIAPNGATVHSFRLSQRARAVAFRDGDCLRLISLHPDHDSAHEP
jgi:hypothetical protein